MQAGKDEKYVGRYYGERRVEITPELVAHYASAVQDQNPWYFGDSPFGGSVAPALILHSEVYHTIDWYLSYFGNLHARQEWEIFAPIMVGDTVTARRQIVERYLKRDREYVVMEVGCYDDEGRLLNRGRTHQSFVNKSAGLVVDKDREKRADRRFDVEQARALKTIAGPEREITIEMCQLFSGPHKNYHNDVEEARKEYIGNAACHARMAAVFAQLFVDGECHGVHCFAVPIRDENDQLCEGVRIEDGGEKMGLNGVDNGTIYFDHVRVPREALLNQYGDVSADGRYSSPIEDADKRFFTMLSTLVQGSATAPNGVATGASNGLRGFPTGVFTLTTAPTLLNESSPGFSAINVQLGQLSCVADDQR